jgi:hypothetical protein
MIGKRRQVLIQSTFILGMAISVEVNAVVRSFI